MKLLKRVTAWFSAAYVAVACLFLTPHWLIQWYGWWIGGSLTVIHVGLVVACAVHSFVQWNDNRFEQEHGYRRQFLSF